MWSGRLTREGRSRRRGRHRSRRARLARHRGRRRARQSRPGRRARRVPAKRSRRRPDRQRSRLQVKGFGNRSRQRKSSTVQKPNPAAGAQALTAPGRAAACMRKGTWAERKEIVPGRARVWGRLAVSRNAHDYAPLPRNDMLIQGQTRNDRLDKSVFTVNFGCSDRDSGGDPSNDSERRR
jgi:hypothetical protein